MCMSIPVLRHAVRGDRFQDHQIAPAEVDREGLGVYLWEVQVVRFRLKDECITATIFASKTSSSSAPSLSNLHLK